jgi:hypothetical protein
MTFNVVNIRRQRSTSYVSNVFDVLIAISDDEYCLERDVTFVKPNICVQTLPS